MEIEEDSSTVQILSKENFIVAGNLSDNAVYALRLGASNSVGTVWSDVVRNFCKFKRRCLPLLKLIHIRKSANCN